MFQLSQIDLARFEHSHGNDDWHEMHDVTPEHDVAEGDPERSWSRGRIFRCGSCDDEVRIVLDERSRTRDR